jgi:hypothetical protein
MANGLIYLPPLAAGYFRTYGFGIFDIPQDKGKPEMHFDWGDARLNKNIKSFQPFDSADIYIYLHVKGIDRPYTLSENVTGQINSGEPMTRIMLEVDALPLSTLGSLIGKKFSDLVEGSEAWLSEALDQYEVAVTMDMSGRTQIASRYQPVREVTTLKERASAVTASNFNQVMTIAEGRRLQDDLASMNYER